MAKNNLSAPVTIVNGVKYFKLVSPYEGDYTKNCGLLGNEIDENFFFLRSNDIESMKLDEEKNLVLTRVDGERLVVNITQEYGEYTFEFDKDTGTLTITQPDGDVEEISGFLVEGRDVHIATDESISGLGTVTDPLRLNPTWRTGQYAPVETVKVLELGGNLPDGEYTGQRFLTQETVDDFGKLYTFREAQAIADQLSQSGWRIPTIDDWDDLLNTIECPEYKNHSKISGWHGKIAGKVLKSKEYWKDEYGDDDYYFGVMPTGIYPNRPDTYDASGLYVTAGFWSQTKSAVGDYYAKIFENDHDDVKETTFNGDARLSLRLVKDGMDKDGNRLPNYYQILYDANDLETILGQTVPVVAMPSDRNSGYTLWTSINLSVMTGARPSEWDSVSGLSSQTGYFICEWDGNIWVKRQMADGESVVIEDYQGRFKEWRLIDGVLENYDQHLEDLVKDAVSAETERAISAETELREMIEAETERATSAETVLQEEIDEETERALSAETMLQEAIDEEAERAMSAETVLQEEIDELAEMIESGQSEIIEMIEAETERAISAETELRDMIEAEISARTEAESALTEGLEQLSAYTEFFRDQVDDLGENVLGVEGSVDEGFSVDFFDATWKPVELTEEEIEALKEEGKLTELTEKPDPTEWRESTAYTEYIVYHNLGSGPDEYLQIVPTTNYISDSDTLVDAIKDIDSGVHDEIEDLKAQDELIQEAIENEVERAQSAETVLQEEIDDLFANDIKSEEYELNIDGLELHRNGGEDPIVISFNANFGNIMPQVTP